MMKVMLNGCEADFEVCVNLMDDEIRENIHDDMAPCGEQKFLDEYVVRHLGKYGEEFKI